jgi:hypothetical protein
MATARPQAEEFTPVNPGTILRGPCPERQTMSRNHQSRSFAALRMTRESEGLRMTI